MKSNRLPAVDGLRAVAALWVVLFHISALSHARFPQVPGIDLFMRSGSTGVSLFLVLSGFCLFLPFAAGRAGRFRTFEFFRRRFRRLAPAYYTSLILSALLVLLIAGPLGRPQPTPEEWAWQLGTHFTLTHSMFPDTFYALNGAYWSLGLEWQLYLGLPLLLIGIRRVGLAPTLAFAIGCNVVYRLGLGIAVGLGVLTAGNSLVDDVLPNQLFGRWAEFALGMLAAELYASQRLVRFARHAPLLMLAIVSLIPVAILSSGFHLSHVLYGGVFFLLLCLVLLSDNLVSRVLSWTPLVAIGTMSYSLYLVHQPLIQTVTEWFSVYEPNASPTAVFFTLVLLFPVLLAIAWILFVAVERRTMGSNTPIPFVPAFKLPRPSALSLTSVGDRRPATPASTAD